MRLPIRARLTAWYALFPGLAVTTTVVGMNLVVDGLQDTLDPSRVSRRVPRV